MAKHSFGKFGLFWSKCHSIGNSCSSTQTHSHIARVKSPHAYSFDLKRFRIGWCHTPTHHAISSVSLFMWNSSPTIKSNNSIGYVDEKFPLFCKQIEMKINTIIIWIVIFKSLKIRRVCQLKGDRKTKVTIAQQFNKFKRRKYF